MSHGNPSIPRHAPSTGVRGWHRFKTRTTLALLLLVTCGTSPASAPSDAALWEKLTKIDARAGKIKTLAARFEQQKFTALLRKPLVSSGRVRVSGSVMRWDTEKPEPLVMRIDPREAQIYYPSQKSLEVYPLDARLGDLAASPLPRLQVLRSRFAFEQVPTSDLDKSVDPARFVALKLTPTDVSLRQYVQQVRVLLDAEHAYIVAAEVTDGDGDRTVLSFRDVHVDTDVGDLALKVPPDTKVSHPLQGLEGRAPQSQGKSR